MSRRTKRFTLCLSEKESQMLRDLAADQGLDQADVLRADLRQRHEARFGRLVQSTEAQAT